MKNIKGILYAIVSSASFGFIPFFSVPMLNNGIDLNSVCFYRFLFATIAMIIFLLFKYNIFKNKFSHVVKECFAISVKEFSTLFMLSFFYASTSIFLTASYAYMPTGIATTIHFLYPVLVTILMIFFFKENLSLLKIVAIVLAISGVMFLSGGVDIINSSSKGMINPTGIGLVLVTVCTYSIYIVGVNNSSVLMNMNGMKMTLYVLAFSCFFFLCNILFRGGSFAPLTTWNHWYNAIGLAIVATLISDFALIYAIKLIGSTITAILGCMEPLTAVIIGVLYFNEKMTSSHIIGILCVFIAVLIIINSRAKRAKLA